MKLVHLVKLVNLGIRMKLVNIVIVAIILIITIILIVASACCALNQYRVKKQKISCGA